MELTVKQRAEIERDILNTIDRMGYRTGTTKAELSARRKALNIVCYGYAMTIADDVVAGRTPWQGTVIKYQAIREWLNA